jgi:uncharacterized membrane protein
MRNVSDKSCTEYQITIFIYVWPLHCVLPTDITGYLVTEKHNHIYIYILLWLGEDLKNFILLLVSTISRFSSYTTFMLLLIFIMYTLKMVAEVTETCGC